MLVPRILHQTWRDNDIPPRCRPLVASVRHHHPEWQYILWTDRDIDTYMRERHPEHYDFFLALTRTICRIDMVRYLWLHDFGGVYLDLDVECFRPLDSLIDALPDEAETALAREPALHEALARPFQPDACLMGNAVMISKPGAPVWMRMVDEIRHGGPRCEKPVEHTGPGMLGRVVMQMMREKPLSNVIFAHVPSRCFYPLEGDLGKLQLSPAEMRNVRAKLQRDVKVYTAHWYHGSWCEFSTMEDDPSSKRRRILIKSGAALVALLVLGILIVSFIAIFRAVLKKRHRK